MRVCMRAITRISLDASLKKPPARTGTRLLILIDDLADERRDLGMVGEAFEVLQAFIGVGELNGPECEGSSECI